MTKNFPKIRLSNFLNDNYSNYTKSNCKIFYPKNNKDINNILDYAKNNKKKILPIGAGLSWYDTIFSTNNIIINLKNYNKKFVFDKKNGILNVSTFYRIYEILEFTKKHNWSLHSIPGSIDVTIGGCIGNDVHGKDSFKCGNFGENIIELDAILPNKKIVKCSKFKNKELFQSIIGGLGLVAVVVSAKLKLKKIAKTYETKHFICSNYKEIIKKIYLDNENYDYVNGWINIFSKKSSLGSGVIFKSKKVFEKEIVKQNNFNTIKFISYFQYLAFSFCVKNNLMHILNYILFYLFKLKNKNYNSYEEITYPLSSYGVDVKKAINPNSFFEIQVILKKNTLPYSLKDFILKCQKLKLSGFVIGIKIHKKNDNYLSFSDDGVSININQIFNKNNFQQTYTKFKYLHDYVIKKKHKIYLCKDFLINHKDLKANYKDAKKFLSIKKKYDPNELLYSDFYKRIKK